MKRNILEYLAEEMLDIIEDARYVLSMSTPLESGVCMCGGDMRDCGGDMRDCVADHVATDSGAYHHARVISDIDELFAEITKLENL